MAEHESLPIKTSKIDYRIIGLIFGLTAGMLIYDYIYQDYVNNHFTFTDVVLILGPLPSGIAGVYVGRRYWGTEVLGKTYLALGIAYLLYFVGEVVYEYIADFTSISSYPSLADVFFGSIYFFLYYHLIRNIKHFKKTTIETRTKIWMILLSVGMVAIFLIASFSQKPPMDFGFYLGIYYVIADAGLLSLSILGALVFRQSVLGKVWLLLVVGFLIFSTADYWYYYTTLYNQYNDSHPVNLIWVLAFMIITYALYKHKKTL